MKLGLPAALAASALLGLASCRSAAPLADKPAARHLELRAEPASPSRLPQGTIVRISVLPVPATEMAWVSATVKIFGAKILALRQDPADKAWKFKTQVPYGFSVPLGSYELKAWGGTSSGERVEGSLTYEVK